MLCLWSRRGVWGNSDAKPAMKQEAPHFNEGRSHDFLGVTQTTANLRIKTLIEGGSLEKIGAGPSTRYRGSAPIE